MLHLNIRSLRKFNVPLCEFVSRKKPRWCGLKWCCTIFQIVYNRRWLTFADLAVSGLLWPNNGQLWCLVSSLVFPSVRSDHQAAWSDQIRQIHQVPSRNPEWHVSIAVAVGRPNKRGQQWHFSTDDKQRYKREHHTRTIHQHSWCFSFTQMAPESFFFEMCEWCVQPSIIRGHNGGWGSRGDLDTPGSSLLDLLICFLTPARALPSLKDLCFLNPKIKTKLRLCLWDQRSNSDNKAER